MPNMQGDEYRDRARLLDRLSLDSVAIELASDRRSLRLHTVSVTYHHRRWPWSTVSSTRLQAVTERKTPRGIGATLVVR